MDRIFKRVPFLASWVTAEKLDVKAIYRRPRYERGEYDEILRVTENGLPAFDLTTPLPVRRHNDWIAKGFEYITLADRNSLAQAAKGLRDHGHDPHEFDQHPEFGPWNPKLYMATAAAEDQTAYDGLALLVDELGADAVLAVKRTSEPAFELPLKLRGIIARSKRVLDPTASDVSTGTAVSTVSDVPMGTRPRTPAPKRKAAKKKTEAPATV